METQESKWKNWSATGNYVGLNFKGGVIILCEHSDQAGIRINSQRPFIVFELRNRRKVVKCSLTKKKPTKLKCLLGLI